MELNFTTEPQPEQLTFSDVDQDQFFVSEDEYLCQKVDETSYTFIADSEGIPWAGHLTDLEGNDPIKRLLPRVTKINF